MMLGMEKKIIGDIALGMGIYDYMWQGVIHGNAIGYIG
jgi:hypothetical protein